MGMGETAKEWFGASLIQKFSSQYSGSRTLAFFTLLLLLVIHTGWYSYYQLNRTTDPCLAVGPCDAEETKTCDSNANRCREFWQQSLNVGDGVAAELLPNRGRLERFVSRSRLDEWLENMNEQTAGVRSRIGGYRCLALTSTENFLKRRDAANPLLKFNLSCDLEATASGPQPTSVEHLMKLFDEMPDSQLSAGGEAERVELMQQLKLLAGQEASAVDEFYKVLNRLKPNISFDWLYHEGAGWVLELIVWSIYGVLASAIAGLITAHRLGIYDGRLFLLFIPRLFLAPLLSVVITAFIASGESGYQVNLQNLPAFLVFAFVMGFNSESLTRTIRDLFNRMFAETPEKKKDEGSEADEDSTESEEPKSLLEEWEESTRERIDELAEEKVTETFGGEETK
jgi:hypothetical protein